MAAADASSASAAATRVASSPYRRIVCGSVLALSAQPARAASKNGRARPVHELAGVAQRAAGDADLDRGVPELGAGAELLRYRERALVGDDQAGVHRHVGRSAPCR